MDKKTSKQAKYLEFLSIYPDKQLYEMRFVINKDSLLFAITVENRES
jgi:hypothetical protein